MKRTKRCTQSRRMFRQFSHVDATSQEDCRSLRPHRAQKFSQTGTFRSTSPTKVEIQSWCRPAEFAVYLRRLAFECHSGAAI